MGPRSKKLWTKDPYHGSIVRMVTDLSFWSDDVIFLNDGVEINLNADVLNKN